MAQDTLIQVRVEVDLKRDADELFLDLGFDTPTAIRMFLKHAIQRRGLPFEVGQAVPNAETIAAKEEADRISRDPNVKSYVDVEEVMMELLADV